jgi:hypothetical protein
MRTQEAVHSLEKVREFINQPDVDFGALIFANVLGIFAVAEVDLRAVPEADLVLYNCDEAGRGPRRKERTEPLRPLQMVLDQSTCRCRRLCRTPDGQPALWKMLTSSTEELTLNENNCVVRSMHSIIVAA